MSEGSSSAPIMVCVVGHGWGARGPVGVRFTFPPPRFPPARRPQDDPSLEDYNVGSVIDDIVNAAFDDVSKYPNGQPGGDGTMDVMLTLGVSHAWLLRRRRATQQRVPCPGGTRGTGRAVRS
jgi:hypothetical protein